MHRAVFGKIILWNEFIQRPEKRFKRAKQPNYIFRIQAAMSVLRWGRVTDNHPES
jgi:hypothetical protein